MSPLLSSLRVGCISDRASSAADTSVDDEKFLFKHQLKVEQVKEFSRQNAKDIIAVGFDLNKTFIFSNYAYMNGAFYENVSRISRQITYNQARATFGFNESCVPSLPSSHHSFSYASPTATTSAKSTSPPSRPRRPSQTASRIFLERRRTFRV